ncbi:MAG TPA: oligopeptide/dipeptide ABC transporter ATP-binding protein [Dongiaceae bacterium]|nr:oligopeptide/dipeptide ABC transporter ATP-binding protein [Dongiaceae bacterium]
MTVFVPMTAAASNRRSGKALELDSVSCRYGRTRFFSPRARLPVVVDNVSLAVAAGETVALVGESGSGKSTLAKTIAGLHPAQSGQIRFAGADITPPIERRAVDLRRGIQIVFQNPDASLNHRHRIGTILGRPLKLFFKMPRARRKEAVASLLAAVQLPADYAARFPSEISGGERQRVAIARALAAEPQLLLCDEVVSALDVSVQATILDLLRSIQQHSHLSILFITHDLAVVRWFADRVAVLYRGQLCEVAPVDRLFAGALHPYTRTLIEAVPQFGRRIVAADLPEIVDRTAPPVSTGCAFAGQCAHAIAGLCREVAPPWHEAEAGGHSVRCHLSPAALAR